MELKTLSEGDTVAIIATAKKIDQQYITRAIKLLESWGLQVQIGKHVLAQHHQFAGSDDQRAEDLQWVVTSPEIKAVICARGGYGTVRIIDKVDYSKLSQYPKWFVGFSDVTVLHNHFHTHFNLPTIHGTVPLNFPKLGTDQNLESLRELLFNGNAQYAIEPHPFNQLGDVTAPIVGGNLAMLESLAGTNSDINTENKILFLEEISEYAYRVDRMLWNLKKGGKLDKLAGLILGGFTDIKEGKDHFGWDGYEMVQEIAKDYNYPVCYGFPAGHQAENRAFMLGAPTYLSVQEDRVTFSQSWQNTTT
jgi:muramoyltetrapeptide carboxypeptidase